MTPHELKIWSEPFEAILAGDKHHEIRLEDGRKFEPGELLWLREYKHPVMYTGRGVLALITRVDRGPDWGLPVGLAVMGIKVLATKESTGQPWRPWSSPKGPGGYFLGGLHEVFSELLALAMAVPEINSQLDTLADDVDRALRKALAEQAKTDKLFITEIINDLHRNGFVPLGKAYTMLHDWADELRERARPALPASRLHKVFNTQIGREFW